MRPSFGKLSGNSLVRACSAIATSHCTIVSYRTKERKAFLDLRLLHKPLQIFAGESVRAIHALLRKHETHFIFPHLHLRNHVQKAIHHLLQQLELAFSSIQNADQHALHKQAASHIADRSSSRTVETPQKRGQHGAEEIILAYVSVFAQSLRSCSWLHSPARSCKLSPPLSSVWPTMSR